MSVKKVSNQLTPSLTNIRTRLNLFAISLFAVYFLSTANCLAAVYYLDAAAGNDSNPGTSSQPWRTIQRALPNYSASPVTAAGDTVIIAAGNYGSVSYSSGSSRNSYITYQAADPANKPLFTSVSISSANAYLKFRNMQIRSSSASTPVTLNNATYAYFEGCDIQGYSYTNYGLNIIYAENITFENCYMGRGAHTLLIRYSRDILMDNCEITDSEKDTFYCVDSYDISLINCFIHSPGGGSHSDTVSWTGTNGIIVRNCLIYNPVARNEQGLYFTDDFGNRWSNAIIENNLIYGNFLGRSINVEGGDNMTFRNNTCVAATTSSIIGNGVAFGGDCSGIKIYNNIFQNSGATFGNAAENYNIYESLLSGSPGSGSITNTSVAFTNESARDYTLTANSVAVDFGDPANATQEDMLGLLRDSRPDAGCYEYNGGPATPGAPVLDPIGDKYVNVAETLTFEVTADDPDSDSLTYSAQNLPQGSQFADRTFQWTPTSLQTGTHQITFIVTDGQLEDSETITITVIPQPPAEKLVAYWQFRELSGNTTADSYDSNNIGTLINDPNWTQGRFDGAVSFDNTNQAVEIPTTGFNVNSGTIIIWAKPAAFSDTTQFLFGHVANGWNNRVQIYTNTIDGSLGIGLGDTHKKQNEIYYLSLNQWQQIALTWNQGNYNVYVNAEKLAEGTYSGLSSLSSYADIANTGYRTDRFEAFAGTIDDTRIYNHDLSGDEIANLYNQHMWLFEPIGEKSVKENENLTFEVVLTDPNDPDIQLSAQPLPTGSEFSQAVFNWTPDYGQAGTYDVNFIAAKGEIEDIETVTITVNNANRPPVLNNIENQIAYVGQTLKFTVSATDPDGDPLRYGAIPLPPGSKFEVDTFTWTPSQTQTGLRNLIYFASDGQSGDKRILSITVLEEAAEPNDVTEGLIGYWKLDDGIGTVAEDSSPSANTGTLIGDPLWSTGKNAGAILFQNTNQAVEVTTAGANLNQGTICLWAKPAALPNYAQFLFAHVANGWNNRVQIYTNTSDGALGIGLGDTHRKDTGIYNLSVNTWNHITLSWHTGSYAVYVNAQKLSEGTYSGLSTMSTYADIANTGYRSDRNEGFNGHIDDVRLYNRALTESEVSTVFLTSGGQ